MSNRSPFVRALAASAAAAVVLAAAIALWHASQLLLVIFAGILFAIFLDALGRPIMRAGIPRPAAVLAAFLALFGSGAGAARLAMPSVERQAEELRAQIPTAADELERRLQKHRWSSAAMRKARTSLTGDSLSRRALGVFGTVTGAAAGVAIVVVTGLYLALQPSVYLAGLRRLFPPPNRETLSRALERLGTTLRWWLLGKLASMAVVGALTWAALAALGMPLGLILAALAGLLAFIPNIGPILALLPALLVAFAQSSGKAAAVFGVYLAVQALENYMITPFIQRRTVSMPPALGLASQAAMAVLAGGLGVLLASPLVACVLVLADDLYDERR